MSLWNTVFFLLILSSQAIASTGVSESNKKELSLPTLLESVSKHFPLIIASTKEMAKAQAEALSNQGGFDPVIKSNSTNVPTGYYNYSVLDTTVEQPTPIWGTRLYAGWRTGQGNFPVYEGKLATYTGGEARAGLEIPLLRNGAIDERRAKIQSSEKGIPIADASLSLQRFDITRTATHKYWDWVGAGKKLAIAKEMLEIAEIRDKALLHRVKHGDAPQIEQTENQRAVIQRQSSLLAAERALQKTSLELSLYYRDEQGTPIQVGGNYLPPGFPEPDKSQVPNTPSELDAEIKSVLNRHPELTRFRLQMEQTEIEVKLAQNQILPRLDVQLGASLDLGSVPNPSKSSAYHLTSNPSEFRASLSFEIPLFLRTARGKAASAQASFEKLDAQLHFARDRIQNNLMDATQSMTTAKKRVELARQELQLARKLEEGERTRFEHGDSTLLTVNIREQVTADAAIKEVDTLIEYFRAKADYIASLAQ